MTGIDGGPPGRRPVRSTSGSPNPVGPARTVDWQPRDGDWTVVIMQADGAAGLAVQARAGATAPGLAWLAGGLFTLGAILVLVGGLLVVLAVHGATQRPTTGAASGWAPPMPRGQSGRMRRPRPASTGLPRMRCRRAGVGRRDRSGR